MRILPPRYIHERPEWPNFRMNSERLAGHLAAVRHLQGRLLGRMTALGFTLQTEATLESLTEEILKSNEIEGERLDKNQVRSSIARRLGVDIGALTPADRNVDGVVEMMLDATQRYSEPLTEARLFGWHAALFPTGHSGIHKISVGAWRTDADGPMQVVSGPIGRKQVHYQAPIADRVDDEMRSFLRWFNEAGDMDIVLKAGIAHLWFVTIHPFEDGNGRIARAITDLLLTRSEQTSQRFYSMSSQIRKERDKYYDLLEAMQKGDLDVTPWLDWFLSCLGRAFEAAETELKDVLSKANFWEVHRDASLNERQRIMVNNLLDGFEGKLTSTKWAKMTKASHDTALRDIEALVEKGILKKDPAGGRSTSYSLSNLHASVAR
ncbi:MAG TPA: Fic family protein [Candidatus Baltobacteraceae bacterium]|jgi:Fic family protein